MIIGEMTDSRIFERDYVCPSLIFLKGVIVIEKSDECNSYDFLYV